MAWNNQTGLLKTIPSEESLPYAPLQSPEENNLHPDLRFLMQFNRDLDRNAQLSKLNEKYLEQRMEALDEHSPKFTEVNELTRIRLHELLLLCAANYANCCEYRAVGDLMVNPRLVLVHVRGCHEPIVKERHKALTEQFRNRARTHADIIRWLKDETSLQIEKPPLIPHSYEILESCGFVSKDYLVSARERAVQIADLAAFLFCGGFKDGLELNNWLRSASPKDSSLMASMMSKLEWKMFRDLGLLISMKICQFFSPSPFQPR